MKPAVLLVATLSATLQAQSPAPPLVELTTQQDHRRMLDLLGIQSLRPGPSGNPKAPNAANVDESKANPYPVLPDPLKTPSLPALFDRGMGIAL